MGNQNETEKQKEEIEIKVNFDKFLLNYKKLTEFDLRRVKERVLYHLLEANKEYLKETFENDFGYFHKNLRQCDATSSGNMDMAIYILLEESKQFWELQEIMSKGIVEYKDVMEEFGRRSFNK